MIQNKKKDLPASTSKVHKHVVSCIFISVLKKKHKRDKLQQKMLLLAPF